MTEKTEMQIEQEQDYLIDIQSGIFIYIQRRIRFLKQEHHENFRIICNEKQENVDALNAYWSDTPPIEEKDPILKFFPPMNLKRAKTKIVLNKSLCVKI